MRHYLFFIFYLSLFTSSLIARGSDLQPIIKQLDIPAIMQCQFQQQRFLQGLNKPLTSTGSIVLHHQQGVALAQQQPFKQLTVLTSNKLILSINQQQQIISAQEQPQLFHITNLLFSLFQGEFQSIPDYFSIKQQTQNEKQWSLALLPKQAPLNQLFQQIELQGKTTLQKLTLIDKQQERTTLEFTHCQAIKTLNDEQQNWFKTQ